MLNRAEQLVDRVKKKWNVEKIPTPPAELLQIQEKAFKEGFVGFKPILYRTLEFTQESEFPGKGIKPEVWFWQSIADGSIDQDAARLREMWVLLDSTQKPNYKYGKQMYENDRRLGAILKGLREKGKIQVPYWCKGIPADSRSGVSWNEINDLVTPEVASILDVNREQVSVPRAIEFNVAGNIYYPGWGDTNTWEWLADRLKYGDRLIGGHSDDGGLARVNRVNADRHDDGIGFRLQVAFPPKAV